MIYRCVLALLPIVSTWTHGIGFKRAEANEDCPWDIKICGDGTWVYREPERNCQFSSCWVDLTES
uniref:AlNc14C7G923 protein n=1 Tax=Albugo laibachii Nc14 TaxID=890382 RepID=F0W1F4_9STRA|nr:AlNc14C7G923 [Albugo laibachii Nc14]|eukprot:CCA14883.1 AlNc14C7G923 [Albugo laibachii Nc14]